MSFIAGRNQLSFYSPVVSVSGLEKMVELTVHQAPNGMLASFQETFYCNRNCSTTSGKSSDGHTFYLWRAKYNIAHKSSSRRIHTRHQESGIVGERYIHLQSQASKVSE